MRSTTTCRRIAAAFFFWCAASVLHASPSIEVTVVGHRTGSKFQASDGSIVIFQPIHEVLSKAREHPKPYIPPAGAAKKNDSEVELSVKTTKAGDVRETAVERSCGSPLLDEAARTWVQSLWRYPAAEQSAVHRERIRFTVTDSDVARAAKDVTTHDAHSDMPPPPYPGFAIYKNWQGTVRMKLISDSAGRVKEARVIGTSDVRLLDLIAKSWCEAYWKLPGNIAIDCSITFQLRGPS